MASTDIRPRARRLGAAVLLTSVLCLLSVAQSRADPLLAAAGDIACPGPPSSSSECQQASTAAEIQLAGPTAVAALGDDQYDSGTLTEFNSTGAYHQTWGRFDSLVHPVPGNHEYSTAGAADYYTYFGAAAGPNSRGYYSYDLAGWHLIALNSNCTDGASPPCDNNEAGAVTAAEMSWLKADLAAHPGVCTLAYWHHPQFTSGSLSIRSPSPGGVTPLWQALYAAHADVVLNGHNHAYERFAQQDPTGAATTAGIREFVVGTGGRSLSGPAAGALVPNDQIYDAAHFGVLFLTLHPTSYEWQFRAINGTVVDRSAAAVPCHAGASIISPADGSYSRSHDVPVAGTAEPGSTVTVSEGSTSRGTTTAGSDGRWSTTAPALADGTHTLTAVATDPANANGPVSNRVRVIVDTTPPAAPSVSSPADGSSLSSHDVSISGTAEPDSTVSVADAGAPQATVTASAGGTWSTLLHDVADGRHVYTAAATDAAGNTGPSSLPVRVAVNTLILDHVSITHGRFALSGSRRGAPHGTAFRFTLNEVASVRIAILARRPGRRSGLGCVSPTHQPRHRKSCIRSVVVGSLWLPRRGPGMNDAGFGGRLAGYALPAGSYRASIQAIGSGGLSPARTVRFTVLGR